MDAPKLFSEVSNEEKIDFFVNCQKLLIAHHPNSDFIFRKNSGSDKISMAIDFCHKYKGYMYQNENICILFNKIVVTDPKENPAIILKNHMYKEPDPNYNGWSIDFVVFRDVKDCLQFCKTFYHPRISHIIFVKNNQPKIYPTTKFLSRLLNIPITS